MKTFKQLFADVEKLQKERYPFSKSNFHDILIEYQNLEKELQEAKRSNVPDSKDGSWIDKWGSCRVCDGKIPTGHTDICDVYKMEMQIRSLTTELALLKRANGEMREILNNIPKCHVPNPPMDVRIDSAAWCHWMDERNKVLSSTPATQPSPTSSLSIPMDVAEKMYEALERNKRWLEVDSEEGCDCGMNEHCSYCSKGISTLNKTDEALSLAEKHGLGKKSNI